MTSPQTDLTAANHLPPTGALSADRKRQYLDAAKQAAFAAAEVQMAHFGKTVEISTKGTNIDLVTNVDRESDEIITRILAEKCPETILLSEEAFDEADRIDLTHTWVIDPIDGTTNYAHGFPQFCISIAYCENNRPEIALVYDPFKKELFTAIRGEGAFMNEQPMSVSQAQHLGDALLATGFPYDIATDTTNLDHFKRILPQCHGVRRPGAAALDLAYTACGRLDGFWELKLSPWDIAAGVLLVEEAGGKITGLCGEPLVLGQRRINLVGSNSSAIHEELVTLLDGKPIISP